MNALNKPPASGQLPTHFLTDDEILVQIGVKMREHRLAMNITQDVLAKHAGVARSSINKLESGQSIQSSILVKISRSLHLLDALLKFVPPVEVDAYEQRREQKPERQRARSKKA